MRLRSVLLLVVTVSSLWAQVQTSVSIDPPGTPNDWLRLRTSESPNSLLTLQATTNFQTWSTVATTHDKFWNFPARAETPGALIYRVRSERRGATNDWKNELLFPEEPLQSPFSADARWVKFAILLNDPTRVYFQDSSKFPFHYDFAAQRLAPFAGIDRAGFDSVSLRRTNQQVVLGAVLYPPTQNYFEYGVQFVGLDAYTPEEISRWFELVKASVYATNGTGAAVVYMPTFEQSEVARTNAAAFAARNIPVGSIERWITRNHVYSRGWAIGRLKYFAAVEISAAFADGRLQPQDILLTDGVPAETPVVAGIISLTPSTPNSHTAILAQSFGIPFVYFPDPADQARIQSLVNRKVVIRATTDFETPVIKIFDVEGTLPPQIEAELLALKKAAPIKYTAKQSFGAINVSADNLGPADIKYFGGKAANFGILRDAVPTNSPVAIAFSFDLWDAFMDQSVATGGTLRQRINQMLAPYTNYPPNIPALKSTLATVRDLIRNETSFTSAQQQAITNALSLFQANRNIRFRSSTNVEDAENFTGAGLYDSYSGCLLDDLDADTTGPCRCDATEANERGVFRAIRRVYASFYNDNAFLERLRHGVKENEVGMGILVHHSFPDAVELANGVATVRRRFGSYQGEMVSQVGAESVTNPSGNSLPEVVNFEGDRIPFLRTLVRYSSRLPLGAYVMDWHADNKTPDDYHNFGKLFVTVAERVRAMYPTKTSFTLDFEYKKDVNLGLVVKQVREIPELTSSGQTTAYLVNEPTTYAIQFGEQGDAFAFHRLKSIWKLDTGSFRLDATNLAQGLYRNGSIEYRIDGVPQTLSGPVNTWPNATVSPDATLNRWTTGAGVDQWNWSMETMFQKTVSGAQPPIFTQQDFRIALIVRYSRPMLKSDYDGTITTTTEDIVILAPRPTHQAGDILREHTFTNKSGVKIETSHYWPKHPSGATVGYTAPLVEFIQTKISGLTPNPITLTNYYAQTYHPFHHNFAEEFLFEPRLDPNVPASDIAALEAANIRYVYVRRDIDQAPLIKAVSAGGVARDL
jgi:hypothetical protein